jgi:hypothetical protein
LRAARAEGRKGGNPGLRRRDRAVLRKRATSRRASRLAQLLRDVDIWLPLVRRLRPAQPWPEVVETVNAALPAGMRRFTPARLVSAVRLLASEGLAERDLLAAAPRGQARRGRGARTRAMEVAAALAAGRPGITLAELGVELTRMRHQPPRGAPVWAPSSVKALLDRARKLGLLAASPSGHGGSG